MNARGFRDLTVYVMSFKSAMEIFALTKRFPRDERYELTSQIRRSSRAVPALVAEAYRRRRYEKVFVDKVSQADTEATETQVWLDFSEGCGYLSSAEHAKLINAYEEIGRMLGGMIANPSAFQHSGF